jgi:hypothetical protein
VDAYRFPDLVSHGRNVPPTGPVSSN